MLTNKRLGKHLGCQQTEFGLSSPPDCGARKYPHGAPGAADSRHSLFREHRGSLLRRRGESQPHPGPNAWGRNPFSTPFPCNWIGRASLSEWRGWGGWWVRGGESFLHLCAGEGRPGHVVLTVWAPPHSHSRLRLWIHDCLLCWVIFIWSFSHRGP